MFEFKKGDAIKLLDDNIKGIVKKVDGESVFVENSFGFLEEYHVSEVLPDGELEDEFPKAKGASNPKEVRLKETKKKDKELKIRKEKNKIKKKGPAKKIKKVNKPTLEIDLHYNKLEYINPNFNIDSILAKQMDSLQNRLEKARENGYDKVIVIHGKGEGVLEKSIKNFCNNRGYAFYDANYEKYQKGATVIELPLNH